MRQRRIASSLAAAAVMAALFAALSPVTASCGGAASPAGYEFVSPGPQPGRIAGLDCLDGLGLPALTVALGLVDGFNPCAFFVLFFLMSLMVHARSRRRMLLVGGVFVIFSGLVYFVFMAAWLEVFLLVGMSWYVTRSAGAVALVLAAINIKDFFWFGRGVSLGIPEDAKPGLFARMRDLVGAASTGSVLTGAVLLAVAANSYELLCTAGMPMVYTRLLTMREVEGASYYAYLALYNAVYVLPLAVIVAAMAATLGRARLTERQGRVLKLLSGNMMLVMGGALIARPELFSSAPAALVMVALSLAVTGAVAGLHERLARHRDGGDGQ